MYCREIKLLKTCAKVFRALKKRIYHDSMTKDTYFIFRQKKRNTDFVSCEIYTVYLLYIFLNKMGFLELKYIKNEKKTSKKQIFTILAHME